MKPLDPQVELKENRHAHAEKRPATLLESFAEELGMNHMTKVQDWCKDIKVLSPTETEVLGRISWKNREVWKTSDIQKAFRVNSRRCKELEHRSSKISLGQGTYYENRNGDIIRKNWEFDIRIVKNL